MVAAKKKNASVDSLTPANGIVEASAPLRLFRGAYRRSDGKLDVIVRDPERYLLLLFVAYPLGQDAGFFRSLVPIFGVVELRCSEHGTRPFSDHSLTPETPLILVTQSRLHIYEADRLLRRSLHRGSGVELQDLTLEGRQTFQTPQLDSVLALLR